MLRYIVTERNFSHLHVTGDDVWGHVTSLLQVTIARHVEWS